MRRAMWRELETWPGWNCEPTAQIERVRVATLHLQQARQFSTLPGPPPLTPDGPERRPRLHTFLSKLGQKIIETCAE
jgi:hypothetical protein